jgi:hypothetical protein
VASTGCQATEQTLSVWYVYDLAHFVVFKSHSLIVLSADDEARKFRCCRLAASERTESTWNSSLAFFDFFFFFLGLSPFAC